MLLLVNYHYIRETYDLKYPGFVGTTPKKFIDQIDHIGKRAQFVSQDDILDHLLRGKKLPTRSVMLTFDDGLREQYEYAFPILKEKGIPAVFYVNSSLFTDKAFLGVHKIHLLRSEYSPDGFIREIKDYLSKVDIPFELEKAMGLGVRQYRYDDSKVAAVKYFLNFILDRHHVREFIDSLFDRTYSDIQDRFSQFYMSENNICELARNRMLGSHGHLHLPTASCDDSELELEVSGSKRILESITNSQISSFSYPYGTKKSYENMGKSLAAAGYQFSITTERKINYSLVNPFYLSRFDNNDIPLGKAYNPINLSDFFDDK